MREKKKKSIYSEREEFSKIDWNAARVVPWMCMCVECLVCTWKCASKKKWEREREGCEDDEKLGEEVRGVIGGPTIEYSWKERESLVKSLSSRAQGDRWQRWHSTEPWMNLPPSDWRWAVGKPFRSFVFAVRRPTGSSQWPVIRQRRWTFVNLLACPHAKLGRYVCQVQRTFFLQAKSCKKRDGKEKSRIIRVRCWKDILFSRKKWIYSEKWKRC